MEQIVFTIISNQQLTPTVFRMELAGCARAFTRPGQFANVKLDGLFLRRPISVCDFTNDSLTLIYRVVGKGTRAMSVMLPGQRLDLLCGLGNGFDTSKSGARPLLIGGGVGLPPMYGLAKELIAQGKLPHILCGFSTAGEVFLVRELEELGARVLVSTADGSAGVRGFVTNLLAAAGEYTYFFACGPEPMLRAVCCASSTSGQLSFEERMGCGFGACMGCSCKTKYASKRICRDGPVLEKEEIIW